MIQLEILKKYIDFSKYDIDRGDVIKAMDEYAKRYHRQQIKKLPSNNEIIKEHDSLKNIKGETLKHTLDKMHRLGYWRGAIWMRNSISNEV